MFLFRCFWGALLGQLVKYIPAIVNRWNYYKHANQIGNPHPFRLLIHRHEANIGGKLKIHNNAAPYLLMNKFYKISEILIRNFWYDPLHPVPASPIRSSHTAFKLLALFEHWAGLKWYLCSESCWLTSDQNLGCLIGLSNSSWLSIQIPIKAFAALLVHDATVWRK